MIVKVWNDNVHPYKEKFRGKTIEIGPRDYVEMDLNEAHIFLGVMPPNIEVDAGGIQKPTSYKMLRIERPDVIKAEPEVRRGRPKGVKDDSIRDRNSSEAKV